MMTSNNNFVDILMNNREKFVDNLFQNYSYEYLLDIFKNIDNGIDKNGLDNEIDKNGLDNGIDNETNDKHLYKLLNGSFEKSRYDKSSIDWIPSMELIHGIISLADHYNINHIEELYSGMGILSALLQKEISKMNKKIHVTTADTFDSVSTCNKLGFVPIAKRSASDYKYYPQLNEPLPQMVIYTYYPQSNVIQTQEINYFDEISDLLLTDKHDIIIIFAPFTSTLYCDQLYHISMSSNYVLKLYNVKAFDKYFSLLTILEKYYKSAMIVYIFVKNGLLLSGDPDQIFAPAISSLNLINMNCYFAKRLRMVYDISSTKLVKSIYRNYDFSKTYYSNHKILKMVKYCSVVKNNKILNIPSYIYDLEEFFLWIKGIVKKFFFVFESRTQFYIFYTQASNLNRQEIKEKFNFPTWVKNEMTIYSYIYLDTINAAGNWKVDPAIFRNTMTDMNTKNKLLLTKKCT